MMRRDKNSDLAVEKARQREEIEREVREFIARGGQIQVLTGARTPVARSIGSVWHGQGDLRIGDS